MCRKKGENGIPWEATCLENGAMFSLAKTSPVLDGPCMCKIFKNFWFVEQRRENNFFHGFIYSMAKSHVSDIILSKFEGGRRMGL